MKARIYILALLLACFTYANAQTMNETIDGKVLTTITTYNASNNLPESTTYPSGLKVKNEYDDAGRLVSVKNFTTGYTYWTASKRNARGHSIVIGKTTENIGNQNKQIQPLHAIYQLFVRFDIFDHVIFKIRY